MLNDPNSLLNDPRAALNKTEDMNKLLRFKQIAERWKQFPGSQPNGTGLTGLGNTGNARDFMRLQDDNLFAQNYMRERGGDTPLSVRFLKQAAPPPSFAELMQKHPEEMLAKDSPFKPRDLYEQQALNHLRRWRA